MAFLSPQTILDDSEEERRDGGVSDSSLGGTKPVTIDSLTVQGTEASALYWKLERDAFLDRYEARLCVTTNHTLCEF